MPSLIADLLERLDRERRYEFEERAGTIEVDNGVARDDAEALALIDLLRTHPGALLRIVAMEVRTDHGSAFVLATATDETDRRFKVLRIVELAELVETHFGGVALLAQI